MKKNNLFICYTPFHINMAFSILKHKNLEKSTLLFLPSLLDKKNLYYFTCSKKHFNSIYIKKIKSSYIADYIFLKNFCRKNKSFDSIFVGNIKTFYSKILIANLKYNSLNTYDDGIGHYIEKGYFNTNNEHWVNKIFLNEKYYYKNLLKKISNHFTLYMDSPIKLNKIKTNYNSVCLDNSNAGNSKCTVFLTGPWSEDGKMNIKDEMKLYNDIISKNNVNFIQKHPREKNNKTCLKILEENLIIEDIVIQNRVKKIIGTNSTALITAKLISNKVECINYYTNKNSIFFSLFEKLGIKQVKIKL